MDIALIVASWAIAVLGLFKGAAADKKTGSILWLPPRRFTGLVFVLLTLCMVLGLAKESYEQREALKSEGRAEATKAMLETLIDDNKTLSEQLLKIANELDQRGCDEDTVKKLKEIQKLISTKRGSGGSNTQPPEPQSSGCEIHYFKKSLDGVEIEGLLRKSGYPLRVLSPNNKLPTNSIWFGKNVKRDDFVQVAERLLRGGVKIRCVGRLDRWDWREYAHLIQVGAGSGCVNKPVLSLEQITRQYDKAFLP